VKVPKEPLDFSCVPKISIYNPIPGVAPTLYNFKDIADQTKLQSFGNHHEENIGSIRSFVKELNRGAKEMGHSLTEIFQNLDVKNL
jgi:hypothetical protein